MARVTRLPDASVITLPVARGARIRLNPVAGSRHILLELRGPHGGDLGGVILGIDDARAIADGLTRLADGVRDPFPGPASPRACVGAEPGAPVGLLSASLDPERTLVAFARLSVPVFADWCTIDVADAAGRPRRLAVVHADTSKRKAAATLARYPHDPGLEHPRSAVWRSGEPDLASEVPDTRVRTAARSREHLAVLRALACRSSIAVPLRVGGRVLGVMTFAVAESRRCYGDDDLPVAVTLARCAAIAADNARLYQRAHATLRSALGTSRGRRARTARKRDVGR